MKLFSFPTRVPFARIDRLCEARVQSSQLLLEPSPVAHVAARDADSFVRRPVKLERVFAPGGVVQPVDVLRDEAPDLAVPLRVRQRVVRRVGNRALGEGAPPGERARPVALLVLLGAHELLVRHRLESSRVRAVGGAVVGDVRLRGRARAGDDQQTVGARDELGERVHLRRRGRAAVRYGRETTR
jgi:hypothetical protein